MNSNFASCKAHGISHSKEQEYYTQRNGGTYARRANISITLFLKKWLRYLWVGGGRRNMAEGPLHLQMC